MQCDELAIPKCTAIHTVCVYPHLSWSATHHTTHTHSHALTNVILTLVHYRVVPGKLSKRLGAGVDRARVESCVPSVYVATFQLDVQYVPAELNSEA